MSKNSFLSNPLEHMPGGVIIFRYKDDQLLYANKTMLDMLECRDFGELLAYTGNQITGILHPEDCQRMRENIACRIEYDRDSFEHPQLRMVTRTGKILHAADCGKKVYDETEGELFYVFVMDMERRMFSYDLDVLTNLPRQEQFISYAQKYHSACEQKKQKPVYIYFDLSNFKNVNRIFGVERADELLKDVAGILQTEFSDGFVARESGDHFITITAATSVLDKTQKAIDRIDALDRKANVFARSGICFVDDLSMSPVKAIKLAREACMTIPKTASEHIQIYSTAYSKSQQVRTYVTEHIDEAIENGEIHVYYQPLIRITNLSLCGFEALARWNSRKFGFLAPFDFIPALEKTEQIHKLDRYMIREICQQYRNTVNKGDIPVPISFNLSIQDFGKIDLTKYIVDLAEEFHIPYSMLRAEIAEDAFASEDEAVATGIESLRKAGIQVAIDNFGRYSTSLEALENARFDKLKLDMGSLPIESEKSQQFIREVIAAAKRMGIKTLARGVETQEQIHFLKQAGCEEVQGYFFGRPVQLADSMAVSESNPDSPYAVLEDDGNKFHYVFLNREFIQVLESIGDLSAEETLAKVNDPANDISHLFREKLNQAEAYEGAMHFAFPIFSDHLSLALNVLSHRENKRLFQLSLTYTIPDTVQEGDEQMPEETNPSKSQLEMDLA